VFQIEPNETAQAEKGGVGLVAAAVQPMRCGNARGGGMGATPYKFGDRRHGTDAFSDLSPTTIDISAAISARDADAAPKSGTTCWPKDLFVSFDLGIS
jgi:hypothetical protein